jgi:hypothetical protein
MAQNAADGLGDVGRRKHGKRDLIKQWLKDVMVAAVDEGDVDREVSEPFGCVEPGESATDDDDARTAGRR